MTKINVIGNLLLIKPFDQKEEKLSGGLEIVNTGAKNEAPSTGTIIGFGEDVESEGLKIENVKVIFKKFAGDEIETDNGEKFVIIDEDSILATYED